MPAPSPTASLTSTAPAASTTILAPSPTASLPSPLLSPRVGILASTSLLAGPGHSFAVLQSILLGTVVDLIGRSPDAIWLYVTVVQSGMRGWIESRYVKVPYNVTRLPIQVFLPATARP